MENLNFLWGLLLINLCSLFDVWASSSAHLTVFQLMTSPDYGAMRLGNSWISPSLVQCVVTCQKYHTSCNSVSYNNILGSCTPGSVIEYGVPPLSSSVGDSFYYGDYCNYDTEFRLFLSGSFIECLFISNHMTTYDVAKKICAEKNGRLMTANTSVRFDQFRQVVQVAIRSNTWIGLSKDAMGVWTWDSGEKYNISRIPEMFRAGQPDNHGGIQNCCRCRFNGVTNLLDDSPCSELEYYICETLV